MLEEGVLIPTVAPGQWRTATTPDGTQIVTATFAGSRDGAALQAQLLSWLRALGACVESSKSSGASVPLHLPRHIAESDGAVTLEFAAPAAIGEAGLSATRSPRDVLTLLAKLAAGLDALHACHIVHGGLGLPSLWWMPDGSVLFPDTALTHALEDVLKAPSSAAGYRSPEVWRGRGFVAASDQYALAIIAFELFSGRRRVVQEDVDRIVSIEPMVLEPGARLYPGAPAELNDVLQRALAASPGARYPSCTAFVQALAGHVEEVHSMPTVHRRSWSDGVAASRRVMALGLVAMASVAAAAVVLRGTIKPSTLPRDLSASLPRLDASVLPTTAAAASGAAGTRAPGAMPRGGGSSGGQGANGSAVQGALPPGSTPSPEGGGVSGRPIGGSRSPSAQTSSAAAPPTMQRTEIATGAGTSSSGSVRLAPTPLRVNGARVPATSAPAARVSVLDRIGGAVRSLFQSTPSRKPAAVSGTSAGTIAEGAGSAGGAASGGAAGPAGNVRDGRTGAIGGTVKAPSVVIPVPVVTQAPTAGSRPAVTRATSSPSTIPGTSSPSGSSPSSVAPATSPPPAAPPPPSSPTSNLATVRLDVPRDSRIYLDGVLVRPTGNLLVVPAGAHDIDIVSGAGSRTRRRISVAAGEQVTVRK